MGNKKSCQYGKYRTLCTCLESCDSENKSDIKVILYAISSISSAVLDVVTPVSFIATTNKG